MSGKTGVIALVCAAALSAAPATLPTHAASSGAVLFEPGTHPRTWTTWGPGHRTVISPHGCEFYVIEGSNSVRRVSQLIAGASAEAETQPLLPVRSTMNVLYGSDPTRWRSQQSLFRKVSYSNVLPGIDVMYYGTDGQIEFDFVVAPGADAGDVRMHISGHDTAAVDGEGNLVITAGGARIIQKRPVGYQSGDSSLRYVPVSWRVTDNGHEVSFQVGRYDRSLPLVIDPILVYSSWQAGNSLDTGLAVARDSQGFMYIAGTTVSAEFAVTDGSYQPTHHGGTDIFVRKIDPNAPRDADVVYSTLLGGTGSEDVAAIVVDGTAVVLAGTTSSVDFPIAGTARQTIPGGSTDAFVARLDLSVGGTDALNWSTYFGGDGAEVARGLAMDPEGLLYVVGGTTSTNFPLEGQAVQSTNIGATEAFLFQMAGNGTVLYSTYLGGSGTDYANTVVAPGGGEVLIGGSTSSYDFPVAGPVWQNANRGAFDGFISRINPSLGSSGLRYSTYLGATGLEELKRIAIDPSGLIVATGYTFSDDFTLAGNAVQRERRGSVDLFLTVLDESKAYPDSLVYSTYFGGADAEVPYALAVGNGLLGVAGYTLSPDLPVTADAFQRGFGGATDGFVVLFDWQGRAASLAHSTYIGGAGGDIAYALTLGPQRTAWVTGTVGSRSLPAFDDDGRAPDSGASDSFLIGIRLDERTPAASESGGSN